MANPDLRDLQLFRVDHSTKRFLTGLKLPQFFYGGNQVSYGGYYLRIGILP
ncbi:hypothetical protein ACFIOY_34955 [Bradyrhizobium sp. TZ2]